MKNLLFLLLLPILFQNCAPKECPYWFQIPASVSPYEEEYHIGDTITITSKFHKDVFELNTEEYYNMEGIIWYPGISIINLISTNQEIIPDFSSNFDFVADSTYNLYIRDLSSGSNYLFADYVFKNDTFELVIKIIPKTSGTFLLNFGNSNDDDQQDYPGKCRRTGFEAKTLMNEGLDNNIELLKLSTFEKYNTWVFEREQVRFYDSGGFCFKVVE
jgi:hypothetical protein